MEILMYTLRILRDDTGTDERYHFRSKDHFVSEFISFIPTDVYTLLKNGGYTVETLRDELITNPPKFVKLSDNITLVVGMGRM
jgi:hypothetical protein